MRLLILPQLGAAILSLSGSQNHFDQDLASAEVIERIERALGTDPCIGSLAKWDRIYYQKGWAEGRMRYIDTMSIAFTFHEANKYEFRSRWRFVEPYQPMIDDRPYKFATGEYDLMTDRFEIWNCGSNVIDNVNGSLPPGWGSITIP